MEKNSQKNNLFDSCCEEEPQDLSEPQIQQNNFQNISCPQIQQNIQKTLNSNFQQMPIPNVKLPPKKNLIQNSLKVNKMNLNKAPVISNSNSMLINPDFEDLDSGNPKITYINHGDNEELNVLSVIITILKDSSYDELYRAIPQTSPEGRVAVFEINPSAIKYFLKKFEDENFSFDDDFTNKNKKFVENILEIFEYLTEIEPDCVLFNYECCSAVGDFLSFPEKEDTLKLIDFVMKRGSYFMFSDFSVKSLLLDWDESIMGKNPFHQIGSNNSKFNLKFNPETLKNCDSAQLKTVGNLSENGQLTIHVMGGTIVFGMDEEKIDNEKYKLEILTIVDNVDDFDLNGRKKNPIYGKSKVMKKNKIYNKLEKNEENNEDIDSNVEKYFVNLKEFKGAIGHVVLHYKTGGKLFLSAGHWIELSNVNVKVDNLKLVSQKQYNNQYDEEIEMIENSNCNEAMKSQKYSELASKVIQKSANCNFSKKMVFKSKKGGF